ncbi:MAG: (Fe-S)-binding protein [Rhodobacteraceae bacterium]|nr:(Fe-S)-binding protein [Alphaproteobacteria bacterium]NNF70838.1 (Fe-S)-binding protein [Paracoccaceae bacterium]NNK67435.1 (Fe-S)-binding protein [Paracoccaceae bacterium]
MEIHTDHHAPPPLTPKTDPVPPYDKQGDMTDEERVDAAFKGFVKDFGQDVAIHMEACIHCGACAHACHFYQTTEDPQYTPIRKLEPFRKAYQREVGPFAPLMRMLGIDSRPSVEELQEWQHLIYDSCTLCGRCTTICPMGIDIADLVKSARHGMYDAGLVPDRLSKITRNAEAKGSQFGTPEEFIETANAIAAAFNVDIPINKEKADILLTTAPGELEGHHKAFADAGKILNKLGYNWTMSSEAFEATNFGYLSGNRELQKRLTTALIDKAVEIGAHTVLLPECGHAYGAARWEWNLWYEKDVPVKVLHMTEFLDQEVGAGRIKLKPVGNTATFHDPCQIVRRGGLTQAPRRLLKALGIDLIEMKDHGDFGYCCGGGGGALANVRAAPLRHKVFDLKRKQIEDTGAERFITSCGQCRITFERGCQETGWDHPPESLMELVADNMID